MPRASLHKFLEFPQAAHMQLVFRAKRETVEFALPEASVSL